MKLPDYLLIGGITVVGISLYAKTAKARNILNNSRPDEASDPEGGVYLKPPAGYRRAGNADVTPLISSQAKASLSHELGTLLGPYTNEQGKTYYIAMETHYNEKKGYHKGASVFIVS